MVYLLALGSALFYGAADFTGGLTSRRAGAIPVVVISQFSGMVLLALLLTSVVVGELAARSRQRLRSIIPSWSKN